MRGLHILTIFAIAAAGTTAAAAAGAESAALRIEISRPEFGALSLILTPQGERRVPFTIVRAGVAASHSVQMDLLKGDLRARKMHGRQVVSLIGGAWQSPARSGATVVHIPFQITRTKRTNPTSRAYELEGELRNDGSLRAVRLRREPLGAVSRFDAACPVTLAGAAAALREEPSNPPPPPELIPAAAHQLSIYIHADSRFYELYGADTPNIIALALETVNTLYERDLDLTLRLAGQTIYSDVASDPFGDGSLNYNQLLDRYRVFAATETEIGGDVLQLLTARRGFKQAIGLTYLGTACGFPALRMGYTEYAYGLATFITTLAHEMGHSLNASHDTNDLSSIMAPTAETIKDENRHFSNFSKNEVSSFISSSGTCLDDSDGDPLTAPSDFSYPIKDEDSDRIRVLIRRRLSGRQGVVYGNVRSTTNGVLANRIVELRSGSNGKLLSTALTNSRGAYQFRVKPRGSYYTFDRLSRKTSRFRVEFS